MQCDSSLPAIRQIEFTMHRVMLNKLTGMVLFPLGLNDVKQTTNKSFILKFEHGFGSLVPTGFNTEFNVFSTIFQDVILI